MYWAPAQGVLALGLVVLFGDLARLGCSRSDHSRGFVPLSAESDARMPSFGLTLFGMALFAGGGMLMSIARRGLAGAGVLLDPERAREDAELRIGVAGVEGSETTRFLTLLREPFARRDGHRLPTLLARVIHQLCDRTAQPGAFGRLSPSGGTLRPRASLVDLFKVDCGSRGRKAPPGDDLGSSARKPEE